MRAIQKHPPPVRTRLCYQSAGRTEDPWLGPPLEAVLDELGRAGEEAAGVVPFGFVSDPLGILFDLDIVGRARALGLRKVFADAETLTAGQRVAPAWRAF